MKERPILFSAPMVRALLAGTKTQTRRVVKPAAQEDQILRAVTGSSGFVYCMDHARMLPYPEVRRIRWDCPYGQPGDRLWVREGYSGSFALTGIPPRDWMPGVPVWYWADGSPEEGDWTKPKPGMHMPRWASRITLEVTEVRVERLQDISEADAIAEGIGKTAHGFWSLYGQHSTEGTYSPRASYRALWGSINGADAWDANPWVWAVTFQATEGAKQ